MGKHHSIFTGPQNKSFPSPSEILCSLRHDIPIELSEPYKKSPAHTVLLAMVTAVVATVDASIRTIFCL